jgi:acetyl-CoA synthetase
LARRACPAAPVGDILGSIMLPEANDYDALRSRFVWRVPERYNIGIDVCDKWAESQPDRLALIEVGEGGGSTRLTFGELRDQSNRLANLLASHEIGRGDRIGVLLPQSRITAIAHIAAFKLGAISIPLFVLFGPDALEYRLKDSGAAAVITDAEGARKLAQIRGELPDLRHVWSVESGPGVVGLAAGMARQPSRLAPADTRAEDPAVIIYTSGTTGAPKGALHAHRVLLGHLPGVEMSHDLFPQAADLIWTPADWAWIGGLFDVLLPALHHGVPVLARRFAKFTGEAAFELIAEHGVRNAFLPPTALKIMRGVPDAERRWSIAMRSVASGGESVGPELIDWGRRTLGVTINEFYGQTECNMIVSSCARLMPPRPGIMGKPVPGHEVAVIDDEGRPCAEGVAGMIAVRRPDPVMFLGYWNNPAATSAKFRGDWLLTGDVGVPESDGWIRFVGRDDDVITSAGYRIGPGEIEDCLLKHPAVQLAAVIGKPDPQRTEIVKAYIVLKPGCPASAELKRELAGHVRDRLAAHEYPREIEFVSELPMTTTGKIIRRALREGARAEAPGASTSLSAPRSKPERPLGAS